MFDIFDSRLILTGTLVAKTALRIGAGRSTEPVGTDLPLIKDVLERPFIPGSSFKGVLRSQVEQVLRAALPGRSKGACIPTGQDEERCISKNEMSRIRDQHRANDQNLADRIWDQSCLVCRTFGSPWLASHVQVRDVLVDEAGWFGQFQVRDGVAIDRDKGTVGQGLLYNYETVPAGTRFSCEIILENAEPWQRGLFWLGLRPFLAGGQGSVGGFTSRGLGRMELAQYEVRLTKRGESPADLIEAVMGSGTRLAGEALEQEVKEWVKALKAEVRRSTPQQEGNHA